MADWPIWRGGNVIDSLVSGYSQALSWTTGLDDTKGPWYQITAATEREYHGLYIQARPNATLRVAMDIGFGGAGSENVIVPDLMLQANNVGTFPTWVPITVPEGSRLAMRAQPAVAAGGAGIEVQVLGLGAGPRIPVGFSRCERLGFTAATTLGVELDAGATANTWGAWAEIGTTSFAWSMLDYHLHDDATPGNAFLEVEVGLGVAASEVALLRGWVFRSGGGLIHPPPLPIPVDIPSGARISARARCSSADASTRTINLVAGGYA